MILSLFITVVFDQPFHNQGFKAGFLCVCKGHMLTTLLKFRFLQPLRLVGCDNKNINITSYCFNNILETHSVYRCFNSIACKIDGILQSKVSPKNFFIRQIDICSVWLLYRNILNQSCQ